jgi:hypothetical protein
MIHETGRATIAFSALLLSVQACAVDRPSTFVGEGRQEATLTGAPGHRTLSVTVGGSPALGSGTQADCELRAEEDVTHRTWHLVPFASDTMEIDAAAVRAVQFSLKPMANRAFRIETDFGEKFCAVGLSFAGTYRPR